MSEQHFSPADVAWDAFVAAHPHGHVLQTSRWAQLKSAFGWSADRVILSGADGRIVAGASLLFRRLPWGQTLAYAPKGPLVNWDVPPQQARSLLDAVQDACRRHHAALLKIEPEMEADPVLSQTLEGLGLRAALPRVQPLSTIHVALEPDEDAILSRMKPKWRYNIRLAERKGVTVRQATMDDLPPIQGLLEQTGGATASAYTARPITGKPRNCLRPTVRRHGCWRNTKAGCWPPSPS